MSSSTSGLRKASADGGEVVVSTAATRAAAGAPMRLPPVGSGRGGSISVIPSSSSMGIGMGQSSSHQTSPVGFGGGSNPGVFSTYPPPARSRELSVVCRPPPQHNGPLAIAPPAVCPTCHRAWDMDRHAPDEDGQSAGNGLPHGLTPQYFRALMPPPMTLAIDDGSTSSAITTPSKGGRLPSTTTTAPRLEPIALHDKDDSEQQTDMGHRHVLGTPPPQMYDYVSPTGPFPRGRRALQSSSSAEVDDGVVCSPRPVLRPSSEKQNEEDEDSLYSPARRPRHTASTSSSPAAQQQQQQPSGPPGGNEGYYARYFTEMQKLGSGTYGGVYLCQHVMEGLILGTFALKKIPVGDNTQYLQTVLREVRILEEVKRHPNVVEYNHSWVETAQLADFGPPVRCLYILMEYATEGSLDTYLDRFGTALSTVAVWYFFLSAVAGTAHLHQKNILHRDLKPQNLLLTGDRGKPPRVLVSDFGTAALQGDSSYSRTGGTGTLEYMAPELLERAPHVTAETYLNHHTKASDVWSLGMILYYLACNATLPSMAPDGTVSLNIQARSPTPRPPEMIELIRAMLQRDPSRRPSCGDILKSTVAQTIMRSFNNQEAMYADDVTQQPQPQPQQQGRVGDGVFHSPRTFELPDSEDDDEERQPVLRTRRPGEAITGGGQQSQRPSSADSGILQSSRVELMSTTVGLDIPLLTQYRSNDATMRGENSASPDYALNATRRNNKMPHVFTTPVPQSNNNRRPRCVDAGVQTDPVRFLD